MTNRPGSITAHLISPSVGANFAMFMVEMRDNGTGLAPAPGVERFVFVLDGIVNVSRGHVSSTDDEGGIIALHADQFAYFPPDMPHMLRSESGTGLLLYERYYSVIHEKLPTFLYGSVDNQPLLDAPGEVFALRKLLPHTHEFDFNMHVMDFLPGQYLNVKEVHYNQHGLLLLAGKGIYRLGDEWVPVTRGDVIWMAPYCPQWYAALGDEPSRYIIYKDTTIDPLDG